MKPIQVLLIATLAFSSPAFAKEEKEEKSLTLAELPEKVAAPIRAAAGGAEVVIETEDDDDGAAFEAKWTAKERKHEMTVSAEGAVLSEVEVIPLAEAPAPVQAAVKAAGELLEIEKIVSKDGTLYEAELRTPAGKLELKLDAAGKEIARELEKKEKKEKEEEQEEKDDGEEDEN